MRALTLRTKYERFSLFILDVFIPRFLSNLKPKMLINSISNSDNAELLKSGQSDFLKKIYIYKKKTKKISHKKALCIYLFYQ